RHIEHAEKLCRVLKEDVYFNVFDALRGSSQGAAQELVAQIAAALGADELSIDLAAKLPTLSVEGQRLLRPGGDGSAEPSTESVVGEGQGEGLEALTAARQAAGQALAEAGPGARLVFTWRVIKR
ncbi:MAG TPA: hypothetical protein VFD88_07425, partial [Clostridia bacterium]|nr:hypothetical protein [Clostridia bacterium]